jgi:hypothetical protein
MCVTVVALVQKNEKKLKITLEQAIKTRGGVEVHLYSFFNLDARWMYLVNATPLPLYPLERDPLPIVPEAGWAQRLACTFAANTATTGIRSPDRPARSESPPGLIHM